MSKAGSEEARHDEELEALAKKYFADWSAPEKTEDALPVVSVRKEPAALVSNRPLVQASVRLVFVGAPPASPDTPRSCCSLSF